MIVARSCLACLLIGNFHQPLLQGFHAKLCASNCLDTFYGGISYQGRPKPPPAPPPTPITTDPSGFKVESDHYDETLFQTPPVDDSKKIKKRVRKKP